MQDSRLFCWLVLQFNYTVYRWKSVFIVLPNIHSARWRETPDSPKMSELFAFPATLDAGLVESLKQQRTEVQQFKQHTEKNMCNHQEGGWLCSLCEHAKVTRHFDSSFEVIEPLTPPYTSPPPLPPPCLLSNSLQSWGDVCRTAEAVSEKL